MISLPFFYVGLFEIYFMIKTRINYLFMQIC